MSERNSRLNEDIAPRLGQDPGLPTKQERTEIAQARRREQDIGKFAREAKRNGDLRGYLEAVRAGYTNRGIENTKDKDARYRETGYQRFVAGSTGVGGQQPAGGAQPTSRLDASPTPRLDAQGAAGTSPENPRSAAQGSSGGQWVNVGGAPSAAPVGTTAPVAGQPAAPTKPKSFFEERASGRQAFVDTVGTLRGKQGGMTPKETEQAKARGAALGLTPQQIQETLDGQTDLSPEAIAGRAKGRKEEAYQKEFGDSDKQWAKLLEKYPDQKAMLEGLTPQQKKDALAKGKENAGEKIASAKAKGGRAGREVQDSLDRIDAFMEKADDASATREGFKDSRSKRLSEKPMLVGGKDVAKATDEDRRMWAEESQRRKVDANRPSLNQFMDSLDDSPGPLDKRPEMDARGMLADQQPILNETALRSDAKPKTLRNDLEATLKGAYDVTIGDYQRYNIKNNAEANKAKEQGKLKENDALINAINYTHGNTGDAKIPTSEDISAYAQKNKVSVKEAGKILKKKSAEARGEAPTAQIDTSKASKEFRSGYDNLRALESFTI